MSTIQWQVNVYKTAPHEAARRMVNITVDLEAFDDWLNEVYLCTNTALLRAGIGGNSDLALPSEDSLAKLFVDAMTDDELLATRQWLLHLASFQ